MKGPEPHEQATVYGALLCMLAEQRESLRQAAVIIYIDAIERGVDPKDMDIDDALISLDLAAVVEQVVDIQGSRLVEYTDPDNIRLTPEEVREALFGGDDEDSAG